MTRHEGTVLVVEDHAQLLAAIRDILTAEGYGVLTASDGVEALEVMQRGLPDLILADIMMPRMDGYALYEQIRSRPEWVSLPFIFLTAKAAKDDVLRGKALGAEDYLTKPFAPDELVVAVRSRLGRARAIRSAMGAEFEQLKHQIVTVLGHELRTPLTYVTGYTELALEDVETLSPDQLQSFLVGIKRGADRLNTLLEDVLMVLRLDSGRASEEFRALARVHGDLTVVVERAVAPHVVQAMDAGVSLEIALPRGLGPVSLCEPLFADALGRLVDNGIKFSRGEEKSVTVSGQAVNGWVEISVCDGGVGIPAEEIPHLFERFRQIGRDQMEQQGVGLGLAICKQLIDLHRGEIVVESTVGEGSTFTIRLPVTDEVPKRRGTGAPEAS